MWSVSSLWTSVHTEKSSPTWVRASCMALFSSFSDHLTRSCIAEDWATENAFNYISWWSLNINIGVNYLNLPSRWFWHPSVERLPSADHCARIQWIVSSHHSVSGLCLLCPFSYEPAASQFPSINQYKSTISSDQSQLNSQVFTLLQYCIENSTQKSPPVYKKFHLQILVLVWN